MEFYDDLIDSSHIQMFMVQSCLLLRVVKKTSQKVPPYLLGGVINPVLILYILYYIYIYTVYIIAIC